METYLRGELSSYSDRTEQLYHDFVAACAAAGRNLTTEGPGAPAAPGGLGLPGRSGTCPAGKMNRPFPEGPGGLSGIFFAAYPPRRAA